jgi:hypothetical protein
MVNEQQRAQTMPGSNDAILWYNVGNWAEFGFGVPNWSNDMESNNGSIRDIVQRTGRAMQIVMFGVDARLSAPPRIDTLKQIHMMCTRARTLLQTGAVAANQSMLRTQHAAPTPQDHLIFPVPFFKVRNTYMKSWCELALTALTEAMQHSDNVRPFDFTMEFAGQIGQYFQRIYRDMAVLLLGVPFAEASKADFTITDAMWQAYDPSKVVPSHEMLDTSPQDLHFPTEDALKVITSGIPTSYLGNLPSWPSMSGAGSSGIATQNTATASFVPAPGA